MTLVDAVIGEEYIIKDIITDDEELNAFLFSLGCYSGEPITVISRKKNSCVVSIKDARYNIDKDLASAISIQFFVITFDNRIVNSRYFLYILVS